MALIEIVYCKVRVQHGRTYRAEVTALTVAVTVETMSNIISSFSATCLLATSSAAARALRESKRERDCERVREKLSEGEKEYLSDQIRNEEMRVNRGQKRGAENRADGKDKKGGKRI